MLTGAQLLLVIFTLFFQKYLTGLFGTTFLLPAMSFNHDTHNSVTIAIMKIKLMMQKKLIFDLY